MLSVSYILLDLLVTCSTLLLLRYLYFSKTRMAGPPLPPGPKPLPIIGNLMDLPKDKAWETYGRWAKVYGDVIHVSIFGRPIIILNTYRAVNDLLERKSSIYSSRPHLTMFHELMDFGGGTAFQPYGSVWRKHRAVYHKQMHQVAVREFQPAQVKAARGLLKLLFQSPQHYRQHIYHMTAGIVMSIAYGHEIAPESDPFVALAESNTKAFVKAVRPGAYLVDIFPKLKHVPAWFPGAGFKIEAQKTRENVKQARDVPFRDVKKHMACTLAAGTARPSFVANALIELSTNDEENEDVDVIKRVAGGIFGAGTGTTASSIHSFLLAMIMYPDVQRKAQVELDNVVGQERLPQFSDRPHLPYINAIVKEVFRWFPVAPTALPHVTTEDDVYEGYSIPAGSVVIPNSWNILHDPETYPDPLTFRPERFLPDKEGKVARDPAISGTFGFGRRICAGRNLADASVWIAAASILSVFNLSNAIDENGQKIDLCFALEPVPGFFSHPQPFPCSIKPRSKEAEAMVMRSEQ
ncbi:cytochrome P450 [Ramaria rubella]|nr:cytochrome P450 [Ramaria rubella]